MKALLIKYKTVVKFILTFILAYVILSIAYKLYLDFSDGSKYYPDYLTHLVACQTEYLLSDFGYKALSVAHENEPSMKLFINDKYVARVIEGCNSVSVIILFVSFMIAFAGRFKRTFLYTLAGGVLIYIVNLARIVILSIGLYHYPWRRDILHTVIFPLIIYGMVFLLWMFWVNRFTKINKTND